MIVHRSNRTEELVAILSKTVATPSGDPFAPETIVVQGPGMERWLSMRLSDHLGIWANPEFLFPQHLLERAFEEVLEVPAQRPSPYEPERLMWTIAELLPGMLEDPSFDPVARYLTAKDDPRKPMQLAERIANLFSDYLIFRPEMILAWEGNRQSPQIQVNPNQAWQPKLWRALREKIGVEHLATHARTFIDEMMHSDADAEPFQDAGVAVSSLQRVSIFGLPTIPPLYLNLLDALSQRAEVHLFLLSPTREFWADIATPREARRRGAGLDPADAESMYFQEGHPLLASLGRLGRDLQSNLESVGYDDGDADLYLDPSLEGTSLLTILQADMLHLRKRGGDDLPALSLELDDQSIRVHSCHGPMREVEVLREELLACFEAHPDLGPEDVVVMAPNIEAYAPFIEAVFDRGRRDRKPVSKGDAEIPHRIADRGPDVTAEIIDAFCRGLDFVSGRFKASEGIDLLAIGCVRARFGIDVEALPELREWIGESGIRWGADAAQRTELEQPDDSANTWRFGLDRLILGLALDEESDSLFQGVRPFEIRSTELLGAFAEFCECLIEHRESLRSPRTPARWCEDLIAFSDALIRSDDVASHQHQLLRGILMEIAKNADLGGFAGEVPLASIRDRIDRGLALASSSLGFLSGGVTFCEFVPMRSIPFRVVCLLGMNDADFPRIRVPMGFDLMASQPVPGDRSRREDDRYLFLEALLSARDRLIITHVGQSVRDGSAIPPSPVVCELIDVLSQSFVVPVLGEGEVNVSTSEVLVVKEALAPFSPQYFEASEDSPHVSYSELYRDAARCLVAERSAAPPFVVEPLAAEEDGAGEEIIALDDFVSFFEHPARAFLRNRLGLMPKAEREGMSDRDPFEPSYLEKWGLGQEVLDRLYDGDDRDAILRVLQGAGGIPSGHVGEVLFDDIEREARSIISRVRDLTAGAPLPPQQIDLALSDARIVGQIDSVWPAGQVRWSFSRIGRKSEMAHWVRHLILSGHVQSADVEEPSASTSYLIGRPEPKSTRMVASFNPVGSAQARLVELLRLYRAGRSAPLPLFARASRVYASEIWKQNSPAKARAQAEREFGADFGASIAEADDVFNRLAFDGVADPLDTCSASDPELSFEAVSLEVFGPLLEHREELP